MSKIIINNYSDVADEEVVGRVLKTMNEYKKYRSWVQDGELKRKVIGYHHSEQKDLDHTNHSKRTKNRHNQI
jgi:hypothetical protein